MAGFVQTLGNANGLTRTITVTVGANTTVGNTVLLACGGTNGYAPQSATDSRGNTYVVDVHNSTGQTAAIVRAHLATALLSGDHITVRFSTSAATTHLSVFAAEFSGIPATSPLDGSVATHFTTSTAAQTSGTVTPAASGAHVWFSAWRRGGSVTAPTVTTPFTERNHVTSGGSYAFGDYAAAGNTARSVTWTGGAANGTIALAAYKVAVATFTGTASLSAAGTLSGAGTITQSGTAALVAAGTLQATGSVTLQTGIAALGASGTLSATGVAGFTGTVALVASGTLSATGTVSGSGPAGYVAIGLIPFQVAIAAAPTVVSVTLAVTR